MKKIKTLFKKDPNNLKLVTNEVDPENQWVLDGDGIATKKYDGTACSIINGDLYKRYDVKKGRGVPAGAIPCQDPDEITGHWPHWVKCDRSNPEDKWHWEALDNLIEWSNKSIKEGQFRPDRDGTFELCGPKIQGNPERFKEHVLIRHGNSIFLNRKWDYGQLKNLLSVRDIEGIVFHHPDGRMCKIRKTDFGLKR